MNTLVVDLGGTVIKAGVIEAGVIVRRTRISGHSESGISQALSRLAETLRALRDDSTTGVAIALPTLVDGRAGRVTAQMKGKYDGLSETDLPAWCQTELGLPLRIENDAHAALLGEWRVGAGRGVDDLVMITLGTGIGSSVLIGGRALRGRHAQAGNLGGHFVIDPYGFECVCGGRGCLEAQQHLHAIDKLAKGDLRFSSSALSHEDTIDYGALFKHYDTDELATTLVTRSMDLWGALVISMIHQFDPSRVIVGGGILQSREIIIPHLQRFADRACTTWGKVAVAPADLGDDAALVGLATLFTHPPEFI